MQILSHVAAAGPNNVRQCKSEIRRRGLNFKNYINRVVHLEFPVFIFCLNCVYQIRVNLCMSNVVRPCCREAAALRGARHAKRGGAAAQQPRRAPPEGVFFISKINF